MHTRFYFYLAVRPNGVPRACITSAQVIQCNVTADCEEQARRVAIAQASYNGLVVSKFTSVRQGPLK